ncbi:MAG: hypothetical protein AAGD23_13405 [Pseudomonadota bacterium]
MSNRTRNLASVWALIAGVALAGAVSSSLSPTGRERLSSIFTGPAATDQDGPVTALVRTGRGQTAQDFDGSAPMVTGSIDREQMPESMDPFDQPEPVAFTDIAELSAEVARLRTENRRLRIERDALRGRLAQVPETPQTTATIMSPGGMAGASNRSTATSPGAFSTPTQPGPNITIRAMPLDQNALSGVRAGRNGGIGASEETIRASLQTAISAETGIEEALQPANATRFAIDIGNGNTLGEIRGRWQSFARTYPEIADALIPAVSVVEGSDGTTRLHLLAGPLPNAADAVDLCARLRDAGVLCSTTLFDGQNLASQ